LNHFYAQIIDDSISQTLVSTSTLDTEIRSKTKQMVKTKKAELLGSLLARRALNKGINSVVFDCGGYKYHGRVKAFAEAVRQAGLLF
jgi:large subunit ribosomal protein L18